MTSIMEAAVAAARVAKKYPKTVAKVIIYTSPMGGMAVAARAMKAIAPKNKEVKRQNRQIDKAEGWLARMMRKLPKM